MSAQSDPQSRLHPSQHEALQRMREQARAVDPELIELCFARVREIIGDTPEGASPAEPRDERERAFLRFSEQFAFSVAAIGDADVQALLEHAEPTAVYEFIAALYSLEMSTRIELAGRALLSPDEGGETP